jgi:hypothetical protein
VGEFFRRGMVLPSVAAQTRSLADSGQNFGRSGPIRPSPASGGQNEPVNLTLNSEFQFARFKVSYMIA